jgi:hypothetical protein
MSADKLAQVTANEEVTTNDSSVPLDHGKLANSKRRRVGRMLETGALATLCNRLRLE